MGFNHIAVIGAGAWGTALALTCARAGRKVTLWEHDAANAEQLKRKRESLFLPGVRIDDGIALAANLAEAARAEAILLVVPAQAARAAAAKLAPLLAAGTPVIVCAKGIERGSKKFMTEVIAECAPAADAGDFVRTEFCRGCGARAADRSYTGGARRQTRRRARASDRLGGVPALSFQRRARRRDRRRGEERACDSRRRRHRPRARRQRAAALTTRGFAELARFGKAYGAKPETMMGLSGLGDLLLTCSSPQSRNFSFGVNLGRGQKPADIHGGLAEGVFTAPVLLRNGAESGRSTCRSRLRWRRCSPEK